MKLRKIGFPQNIKAFVQKGIGKKSINTLGASSGDDSVYLDTGRLMEMKKIDKPKKK